MVAGWIERGAQDGSFGFGQFSWFQPTQQFQFIGAPKDANKVAEIFISLCPQ